MIIIKTCKRLFSGKLPSSTSSRIGNRLINTQQRYQASMSGKAVAKVDGVVVAEADSYETVEGNVYVRFNPSINLSPLLQKFISLATTQTAVFIRFHVESLITLIILTNKLPFSLSSCFIKNSSHQAHLNANTIPRQIFIQLVHGKEKPVTIR